MSIDEGTVLAGRYELVTVLGRGGMGTVFRARDTRLGRDVAVKVLDQPLASDGEFLERFRREARAAASLQHANVVSVFDGGEADGAHYIVMEHVDGPTLQDVLRAEGPLAPGRAIVVAAAVADALGAAHRIGLVHRDVKPSNVLVTPEGQVKVTDFGIARAASDATLTTVDAVMGSVPYVSPEQVRGEQAQPASDVYGLGCVLYALLTGRPPFEGDVAISVLHQHVNTLPEAPSVRRRGVSDELDALVLLMLAKDPADRPADGDTAAALLRDPAGAGAGATAVLPMVPTEVIERTRSLEAPVTATRVLPPAEATRVSRSGASGSSGSGGGGAAGGWRGAGRSDDDRPGAHRGRRLALAALFVVAVVGAVALLGDDAIEGTADAPLGPTSPEPATDPTVAPPAPDPEPEPDGVGPVLEEMRDLIGASRGSSMSHEAADELGDKLSKIVEEHDEQDWDEARSKTREFRRELEKLTREGKVDDAPAQTLADAAGMLEGWYRQARSPQGGSDDEEEDD